MYLVECLVAISERAASHLGTLSQVALVGLLIAIFTTVRRRHEASGSEERGRAVQMALYSGPHEFGPVRMSDFHWLDSRYYSESERRLEGMGFRCFGDVENLTASSAFPEMRTAIRDLVGEDGACAACVWQVKTRGWRRLLSLLGIAGGDVRGMDLGTEFSDGTFVSTSNNPDPDFIRDVTGIEHLVLPTETPIEEMVAVHRQRVAAFLADHAGTEPIRVGTARDLRQSVARAHDLRCEEMARNRFGDLRKFAGVVTGSRPSKLGPKFCETTRELSRLQRHLS